ncbi:hypothetical protein PRIC1_007581 [Phytophthora ramorum]|nr:Transcription termination factor MTERF5, chloroplastic [Phytophthora ramorum]
MLRLSLLQRSVRPAQTLARGFASATPTPVDDAMASRKQQSHYYARITRKFQPGELSLEAVDRTALFLTNRGMSQVHALQAIGHHITLCKYSQEMMEIKIEWLSNLGLSHDKINAVIRHKPSILGISIEKYEAVVEWYISQGVPKEKIPYVINVFPQAMLCSIVENLEAKVNLLKKMGCNDSQVARVLTMAPQIFSIGVERLYANMEYIAKLGVPLDNLPSFIAIVPQCLALKVTRIQETVDALDEMFGDGAGIRALIWNGRIVMHNVGGLRQSFSYLISLGFTAERVEKNTRFIMRSVGRVLRPRAEFLKASGYDVVADIKWISLAEGQFVAKYPDYTAYLTSYNARPN